MSKESNHTPECMHCGDYYPTKRWALGYKMCKNCGETAARIARRSWTVVQEYTKGNYQFVTSTSAENTLKQTNPKNIRN